MVLMGRDEQGTLHGTIGEDMGGRGATSGMGGQARPDTAASLFAEEGKRYANGYKTGSFWNPDGRGPFWGPRGMVRIDWYVTRGSDRHPTIRASWAERTVAPRLVRVNGHDIRKPAEGITDRAVKFPFTEDGLREAIRFASTVTTNL